MLRLSPPQKKLSTNLTNKTNLDWGRPPTTQLVFMRIFCGAPYVGTSLGASDYSVFGPMVPVNAEYWSLYNVALSLLTLLHTI